MNDRDIKRLHLLLVQTGKVYRKAKKRLNQEKVIKRAMLNESYLDPNINQRIGKRLTECREIKRHYYQTAQQLKELIYG